MSQSESHRDHRVLKRLLEKSTANPDRVRRVMDIYDAYLERFERLRDQRAWRKFTDLDHAIGRGTGYLATVFGKQEALPFDRLLMALDFLGCDLTTFADSVTWIPPRETPRDGYLAGFCLRSKSESVPTYLGPLLDWGPRLKVDDSASEFPLDADGAIELSHSHLPAAVKLINGNVEALVAAKPESLPSSSVREVCRLLAVLADCLRNRGHRYSAAKLFDLTFALERQIDQPLVRAFVYRLASYLLADWGLLDESLEFVQRSERLCLWEGDAAGLGRSLFIKGTLISMRGSYAAAIKSFEASLAFQGDDDWHFALAIRVEIALAWLAMGDASEAKRALGEPAPDRLNEITGAHLLAVQAEISSRLSNFEEAEALFLRADAAFTSHGSVQDRLILGLKRVRHYSRHDRPRFVTSLAKDLAQLANASPESSAVSRAVVVDLLKHALAGELPLKLINSAIVELQGSPALRLH